MRTSIASFFLFVLSWATFLGQEKSSELVSSIFSTTQRAQQCLELEDYSACIQKVDSIERLFAEFQKVDPSNADSTFLISAYLFGVEAETELGNIDSAIKRCEKLCFLASSKLAILLQIGYTKEAYLGFWHQLWELFRMAGRYKESLWVAQAMVQTAEALLPNLVNSQINILGLSYAKMGDHLMASRCYQLVYDNFIKDGSWKSSPMDYYVVASNLSMTYYKINLYEKGVDVLTSSETSYVSELLKTKDPHYYYDIKKLELRGLLEMARLHESGQIAKELYNFAAEQFGTSSQEYIAALNAMGQYYTHSIELSMATDSMKEEASLLFNEIDSFWNEHRDVRLQRDFNISLNNKAAYYSSIDNKQKAIEVYQELINLHKKDKTIPIDERIHPIINYAIACYDVENWVESRQLLIHALDLCEKENYMRSEACAKICRNLAELSLLDYDYAKADEYASLGYNISCLLGNDNLEMAYCLKELAIVSARIGNYDQSFEYQKKALEIKNRLKIPLTPTDWLVLADACVQDSLVIQATDYANDIMESTGDFSKKAYMQTLRGRAYVGMREFEKAEDCLIESLSIREQENDIIQVGIAICDLCTLYTGWHKYDKAESYAQKALKLIPQELMTIANVAALYYAQGNQLEFEKILPCLMSSIKGQIQNAFKYMDARQRQAYMESDMNILHFAEELPRRFPNSSICIQAGYDAALLEKALLLGKNSSFQYLASHSQDDNVKNEYKNWLSLSSQIQTEKDSIEHDKLASRLSVSEKILQSYLWEKDSLRMSYKWDDIQKGLPKNAVAIEFIEYDASQDILDIAHDSTIYAALVIYPDAECPNIIPVCTSKELEQFIEKGANAYASIYASQIYEKVWNSILSSHNGIEQIFFSPTGLLHQINLEALIMPDGHIVGEKYLMHRISSTRNLLEEKHHQPYKQAVLYGGLHYAIQDVSHNQNQVVPQTKCIVLDKYEKTDSLMRAGISYLEGTLTEVASINKILKKNKIKSLVFDGNKGTEETFKALSGQNIDILHIATHGFCFQGQYTSIPAGYRNYIWQESSSFRSDPMSRCGLLLSGAQPAWVGDSIPRGTEDGILLAQEVALLDLSSVDIVALSACQTGKGEISDDGVFGLQRAFKNAGANTIIMSLWNVDDESAALMMSCFYENLLKGYGKVESFSLARKRVKKEKPSPSHWAGFIMLDGE